MSISIKEKIQTDLAFLNPLGEQRTKNITCQTILDILQRKSEYKKDLTTEEEKNLYSCLKFELRELCETKLPFRMVKIVKECLKDNRRCPYQLYRLYNTKTPAPLAKNERKKVIVSLRNQLVQTGLVYESAFKIIELIHWVHGTNSGILPMLGSSHYKMLCTGDLLDQGTAPMCGELTLGGMQASACSQKWISVETVRDIARSWRYAWIVSNTFKSERFEKSDLIFTECLNKLQTLPLDDDKWDEYIITLLQLKQWLPDEFKQLQEKFCEEIHLLICNLTEKEVIASTMQSPEISERYFFSCRRLSRLKKVFLSPSNMILSEEDKSMIIDPFPILIASRTSKCFFIKGTSEAYISSAKWGEEVDTVFVKESNIPQLQKWIEKQGLMDKIQLHDIKEISPFYDSAVDYPIHHSLNDAIGERPVLSLEDYDVIQKRIQNFVLLYLPTFSKREGYGVVRGLCTALFSAIIMEMRLSQREKIMTQPKDIPIAGFFHGMGCKDEKSSISLEQKIIEDADAIISNPKSLERANLWICKDRFPEDILDLFINETLLLIQLIEQPTITEFLQSSPDPFRALLQVIQFSNKFLFLMATFRNSIELFPSSSNYILNPTIEKEIVDFFNHLTTKDVIN